MPYNNFGIIDAGILAMARQNATSPSGVFDQQNFNTFLDAMRTGSGETLLIVPSQIFDELQTQDRMALNNYINARQGIEIWEPARYNGTDSITLQSFGKNRGEFSIAEIYQFLQNSGVSKYQIDIFSNDTFPGTRPMFGKTGSQVPIVVDIDGRRIAPINSEEIISRARELGIISNEFAAAYIERAIEIGKKGYSDLPWPGTEQWFRKSSPYGALEVVSRLAGSGPPSVGEWLNSSDARALHPEMFDERMSIEGSARQQIDDIRRSPTSYSPDGKMTPSARGAIGAIEVATNAAMIGLAYYDAVETGERAANLWRQGDQAGAVRELVGAEGRWLGMLWGGELGLTVGGSLGGPIGATLGMLAGAIAGSIVGDAGLRDISHWLENLFGDRTIHRDPLVLDLSATGSGVAFTKFSLSNVHFDLNSDGYAERRDCQDFRVWAGG